MRKKMTPEEKKKRNSENTRRWRAKNPEKTNLAARNRYAANPEKYRDLSRIYAAENSEERKEYKRKRRLEQPEKVHAERRKQYEKNPEKERAYTRKWYRKNRDKARQQKHEHYLENQDTMRARNANNYRLNPVKHREYGRRWRQRNPEYTKAQNDRYYAAHPDKMIQKSHARRARLLGSMAIPIGKNFWAEAKMAWSGCCAYCGQPCEKPERDHFVPIARGGAHAEYNLVPACHKCNSSKAAADPFAFLHDLRVKKRQSYQGENSPGGDKVPP